MVINFAVENNPHGLIFIRQRLAGRGIEIDDRKPVVTEKAIDQPIILQGQRRGRCIVNSLRPAVGQAADQNAIAIGTPVLQRRQPFATRSSGSGFSGVIQPKMPHTARATYRVSSLKIEVLSLEESPQLLYFSRMNTNSLQPKSPPQVFKRCS